MVRIIDAFVDILDFKALGFAHMWLKWNVHSKN